jgi:hypothetical protein
MAANSKLAEDLPPTTSGGQGNLLIGSKYLGYSIRQASSQECQAGLAVVAAHAWVALKGHALGMRPPVPETLLEKREIYGTEIGG